VRVSAELDFDQTNRVTETQRTDPELPPISSSSSVEEYTGAGAAGNTPGGVLGPDNIGTPDNGNDSGEYRSESVTVNNPVDTVRDETRRYCPVRRNRERSIPSLDTGVYALRGPPPGARLRPGAVSRAARPRPEEVIARAR